jgi:hypothetical protein
MTQSNSKSFTATGNGTILNTTVGQQVNYATSGTFVGTWAVRCTDNNGASYTTLATGTGVASGSVVADPSPNHTASPGARCDVVFQCDAYTSGTIVCALNLTEPATVRGLIQMGGKVGGTAGFTAGGTANAADTFLLACPASQTAATAVIPVTGLKAGDIIDSFNLIGEGVFTGTGSTIDVALRSQAATAGVITDALVSSMTQFVSATANVILNAANTKRLLVEETTVAANTTYYLLITVTTAAGDSIKIVGANVNVR